MNRIEAALEALREIASDRIARVPQATPAGGKISTLPAARDKRVIEETSPQSLGHGVSEEPQTKRCYACSGWLFWKSIHGAVTCVVCHQPPNRNLVSEWLWVEEATKRIQ